MRPLSPLAGILAVAAMALPAHAIVGGTPADAAFGAHLIEVVSPAGGCSGVVVGRNLVLTAGHCVDRPVPHAMLLRSGNGLTTIEIDAVAIHPNWTRAQFERGKPGPDIALVRTRGALPEAFRPLPLSRVTGLPANGTRFVLAGRGVAAEGDARSAGVARTVPQAVLLRFVGGQVKLAPIGKAPAGACDLDSGGAVLTEEDGQTVLAGTIAYAVGAGARGCGAASVVTMIAPVAAWLAGAAAKFGAKLGE